MVLNSTKDSTYICMYCTYPLYQVYLYICIYMHVYPSTLSDHFHPLSPNPSTVAPEEPPGGACVEGMAMHRGMIRIWTSSSAARILKANTTQYCIIYPSVGLVLVGHEDEWYFGYTCFLNYILVVEVYKGPTGDNVYT